MGVGRRTVVRTATWATPVVALAATAPAYAMSCSPGSPATVGVQTAAAAWTQVGVGNSALQYTFVLRNTGSSETGALQIETSLPAGINHIYYSGTPTVTAGWTVATSDSGGDGDLYPDRLTLTRATGIPACSDITVTATCRILDGFRWLGSDPGDLLTRPWSVTAGALSASGTLTFTGP